MPIQQDNQALVLRQSQIIIGLFMSMQFKIFLDLPVFCISCPRIQVEILNYQFNTKMISAKELNRTACCYRYTLVVEPERADAAGNILQTSSPTLINEAI